MTQSTSFAPFPLVDARAPCIASVDVALPAHRYRQSELAAALVKRWQSRPKVVARIEQFTRSVEVDARCLALPLEAYETLGGFGEANNAFIRVGTELGARAIRGALARAGLEVEDVDALFFTTVTGLAAPTIDARLVNVLGLRKDVRRTPMFGLGCVGGAAGIARASDYLRGHPDHVAVLLSVELCSLTLQDEFSVANLIASGLFADGAAAVVMMGSERKARPSPSSVRGIAQPRVVDTASAFFPDTERVMGWDIGERGFTLVLSAEVPAIVHRYLPDEVNAFLAKHGLAREDIRRWVCHPGGPKVILAIEEALRLPPDALAITRASLASIGNLSSASVLHVLSETPAARGDVGVLMAMGPGFCAELVLLAW